MGATEVIVEETADRSIAYYMCKAVSGHPLTHVASTMGHSDVKVATHLIDTYLTRIECDFFTSQITYGGFWQEGFGWSVMETTEMPTLPTRTIKM